MIYKEKLAGGGGNSLDYTHIVTVGELVGSYAYGYFSSSVTTGIGSISPSGLFADNDILYIHNQIVQFTTGNRIFTVHVCLNDTNLNDTNSVIYLALPSTKQVYLNGADISSGTASYSYFERDKPMLFSPDDVGKEVPIWLATTPPPFEYERLLADS